MGHEKKYTKTERRGLPGGPNEMFTYVTGVFSSSPGFYKAESSIEGQGLFADKTFSPGDLIGLAHEDGVPVTELGKFHNHNENDPNMSSRLIGNQRYVFANKDIKPGDELTTNYRLQPELEQPEDFLAKAQDGNGENIIRPRGDSYEYKREGDKFYTRKREGEWESEEQPDWTLASGDVAAAIQQKVYGEEQPKSLLQELTEGVGSFYKELVSERAEQKEALQKIDTSGYGIRVIQYPYGHDGMESGHIEAVLYDKNTDEIVNKIPDTDFIGYINRWPNDGNREVTESKYKDDESVRVVDLALPEEAVRDFIGNAQNFLPSKRDQVHTNLGISNKNDLPISAGSNPRRYDFLESNCATGICIGLNMDPDSPVNQTGGITDPNEVMDNILTTFSNYYDAEEDVKGDRTSRREGITKLVTERLGIKPNSRVLSIAVDYLDGLGRNELTDALEDLSKKPIVQRLAKGESFMSPLGIGQTASEISDAFGELPDGTMSALLGMAWEQGPNAYIRENTPFDFSSEGVDNIVPWWQRNVISPVGDALEDAGKSVSNFFGLRSHGGEEGHSPKSIIEVDKDVEIPYDESLQYKFKPKLDKTKFSINTDFKKKFGTKFHTVLPTDTQIDFKTTLPLNIFSSVLPFDLPDYNKSKIDLSLKQPIGDDTSIGFDINAAIKDGKTQLTPQLTFKHRFEEGGENDPIYVASSDDPRYQKYLKHLDLYNQLSNERETFLEKRRAMNLDMYKNMLEWYNANGFTDQEDLERIAEIKEEIELLEAAKGDYTVRKGLDQRTSGTSRNLSEIKSKGASFNIGGRSEEYMKLIDELGVDSNWLSAGTDGRYYLPTIEKPDQVVIVDEGYGAAADAENAFNKMQAVKKEIAKEQNSDINDPDIPEGYQLVQGYRDPLFGKTIGDRYVYAGPSSDNKPDIPVGPTLEDYQAWKNTQPERPTGERTISASFKKGGSVSWMWKGKKYYGTLIPSMEDEKNRYARTKNGKIKKLPKKQEGGQMSRAERIYNLIPPTGYNDIGNIFNYFKVDSDSPVPVRTEMTDPRGEEMYKQYLGINTTPKYLRPSSSKPSISKDKNVQYYQLDPELEKSIFGAVGNTLKVGDIKQMGELDLPERFNVDDNYGGYNMWSGLGNFTVSKGVDDEGKEYISYYDKYDLPDYIQDRLKGQPYEVYGRINPNMVREFQGSEIQDEKDYDALYGKGAYREQFLEKVNPQHLVSGTTDILNKQRLFREDMKKGVSLKKSQRGGTVSELWEEVTGTPWSQAKAQGLTDGGYDANIQLRNQLIQSPSKFKQRPSNTLPPANTNSNAANATLSPEEINDKINRAKDFNSAFGIARDYYGANKIFEYNGKQYGTNLAGETFEPSEEDMVAAGLKPKQRDKIYKQNRSVVSPYTDDNIVEFDEYEDFENIKKNNANLNRMDQADLIVSYQLANAKKPYLIVDEQMGRMHLYYPGEEQPVESYPILSGSNAGDAQTVTKADYFYNGKKLDQQGLNDAMTATGASSVDALMDMPGYSAKTNWSAGNKTTGAGKFTIGTINEDSGFYDDSGQNRKTPSFVLKNEDGNEVSTVIHTVPSSMNAARINALTAQDPANMRMTNGCINGMCSDLIEMHNIHDIGEGSEIFILPEDQGNKFVYENGKLNFRTTFQNRVDAENYVDAEGNVQRGQGINRSRNTLNYRPIKIDIDKETFENDKFTYFDFDDEQEYNTVVVPFVKSLEDNKQKIMKTMQVTGDVYNDIAKISLGILGNETNFGDTHSEFGNILRGASKVMNEARSSSPDYQFKYQPSIQLGNEKVPVTGGLVPERFTGAKSDDNSVGLTQFRWKWVEKDPELKKRLKTLGITSNVDFMDAEKAALGTAAVLAYYYNNRKVDDIYRDLPKHWAGSIKRDPDRKVYADNVMNNIKYFTLKEKTTFQGGGGVGQDILLRQAYAESTFRPKVTSSANAKGLTQIRPNVLSDYKKANNIEGDVDLTNVSDAVDVQKWYMNDLYNASFIDKENQSEDVRLAKTLAAYNWGRGNLLNFLNEEKESSDIYKSLDWVEKLPNETKTYINKILGNNDQFNEDYNKAVNNEKYTYIVNEYKSIGGEISDLKIYKDYVNGLYDGKPNLKKAERIYDKLNRVYYYKAGQVGMSAPNYIMSYLD